MNFVYTNGTNNLVEIQVRNDNGSLPDYSVYNRYVLEMKGINSTITRDTSVDTLPITGTKDGRLSFNFLLARILPDSYSITLTGFLPGQGIGVPIFDNVCGPFFCVEIKPLSDQEPFLDVFCFEINTGTFDNISLLVPGYTAGLCFNADGTRIIFTDGDELISHDLNVPFDISSGTGESGRSPIFGIGQGGTLIQSAPRGIAFNADGTSVYIMGRVPAVIDTYSLQEPYNITSLSSPTRHSLSSIDTLPHDMVWAAGGSRYYFIGRQFSRIYQIDVSTPFDVSTSSFNGVFYDYSLLPNTNTPRGLAIDIEGSRLFFSADDDGSSNISYVYQLNLGISFDLGSVQSLTFLDVVQQESIPHGIAFNNEGTKFYLGSRNAFVFQYSLNCS